MMPPEAMLDALADAFQTALGENFVGFYVHGSYAMGCFNPMKSDLDFIAVCREEPSASVKKEILDAVVRLERFAPPKGLEMHLMLEEDCRVYEHPPRFVLHYSPAHAASYADSPMDFIFRMRGHDPDLAAHLTVLRARGLRLCGAEIRDIFCEVPRWAYWDSLMEDASWPEGDEMYHVLNRCRTLAYAREGRILSKKEGGIWALAHLEEKWKNVVKDALDCYGSGRTMARTDEAALFCSEMLMRLRNEKDLAAADANNYTSET